MNTMMKINKIKHASVFNRVKKLVRELKKIKYSVVM